MPILSSSIFTTHFANEPSNTYARKNFIFTLTCNRTNGSSRFFELGVTFLFLTICPLVSLAAEDLTGTPRNSPTTPGALEVSGPVTPPTPPVKSTTIKATYSADISQTGEKGSWPGHSAGPQTVPIRVVLKFDPSNLVTDYTDVKLTVQIVYVSPTAKTQSWSIGPYLGDPESDNGVTAFARANTKYVTTTQFREPGTYTVSLGTKAVSDLKASKSFALSIKMENESTLQSFAVVAKGSAELTVSAEKAWKVAPYRKNPTRPIFDGTKYEACLSNPSIADKKACNKSPHWKKIGDVPKGTACEDAKIKPLSKTIEYHFSTNAKGQRGLAACQKE